MTGTTVLAGRVVHTPDARDTAVADAAAVQTLLRCWVRETGLAVPATGAQLRIRLPATGLDLTVPVRYRSACGWHRFGPVRLMVDEYHAAPGVDAGLLAALLVREVTTRHRLPAHVAADALGRLVDSVRRSAVHVQASRHSAEPPAAPFQASAVPFQASAVPFLAAERSLVFGHPFHPAASSRQEASATELADYSPELGGQFQLHWFAAHPSVARIAGAQTVLTTLRELAADAGLPDGYVPVPAHPWQARDVRSRPAVATLLADGRLVDVGPAGAPWAPTSSLRTVWRADAPVMLKLSLGMRITNSRRENLRTELDLGVQVANWHDAELGSWLAARYPAFRLVTDPAWVGVDVEPTGTTDSGLEYSLRSVPFGAADRVVCVAALVADQVAPATGRPPTTEPPTTEPPTTAAEPPTTATATATTEPATTASLRLPLVDLTEALARQTGRPRDDVAAAWFERYLDVLVEPVLGLYLERGVGVEAHHQNALVTLDDAGWPVAGWYRDSQGYYLAASHADAVRRLVPGFGDRVAAIFDERLVEKRIIYYVVVNNVMGLIGALGAAGVVGEARLLAAFQRRLRRLAATSAGASASSLLDSLLRDPVLPCKANLLTCIDGRDELVGPVASQSVYVSVPNPLVEVPL